MTTISPAGERTAQPLTLADLLPRTRATDIALVVGFALFTALAAQVRIPLGFTPVPVTGQTLAVLLAGGFLGARRGGLSQLLYVGLGAVGLPFYADGASGLTSGGRLIPTAGYLVGFVAAAYLVGRLSERSADRNLLSSIPAFLAGTVVIYGLGASFLAWSLGIPLVTADLADPSALALGILPFVVGDIIKATLAGLLLPALWAGVDRRS